MKSIDDIVSLYMARRQSQGDMLERMREIRDAYNYDLIIPLPEMDRNERPAIANLIHVTIEQMSMRVASTLPFVFYPPTKPGFKASEENARVKELATMGWWSGNKMPAKLRQRARWFYGYASSPVVIRPDSKKGYPRWEIRDPLSTYPAQTTDVSDMTPTDCIFAYIRERAWVSANYPKAANQINPSGKALPTDKYTLIEYHDENEVVLAILDETSAYGNQQSYTELTRYVQLTGQPQVVIPRRITLDRTQPQLTGLVGMQQAQARLQALDLIAIEKSVFPNLYLVSRPGEVAQFEAGPFDGRTGKISEISGGQIEKIPLDPGFSTTQAIDRLERNARVTAGSPANFGGESPTNIRTGRLGDSVISATIDFNIQETQELLAASMVEENKCAIAVAKAYFGNQKKSFYVNFAGTKANVDYVPNVVFDTDDNEVTFPYAGADANTMSQTGGQKIGMGTMSKRTYMQNDPQIGDATMEWDRITVEQLESSLLATVQQQVQQGQLAITDLAKITDLVSTNKMNLTEAFIKVHAEAQALQAQQVQPTAPEAQPGIAAPGSGAQASIAGPTPGTSNLADLLKSLRGSGQSA